MNGTVGRIVAAVKRWVGLSCRRDPLVEMRAVRSAAREIRERLANGGEPPERVVEELFEVFADGRVVRRRQRNG